MKRNLTIELYEFTPIEGIGEEALLRAIRKTQSRFFQKQPGFIKGQVLRSGDKWISINQWNSVIEAKKALEVFLNHSACLPFVQMISPSSERRIFLERVISYNSTLLR